MTGLKVWIDEDLCTGDVVQPSDGLTVGSIIFPTHPVEDSSDDDSEDETDCADQFGDHAGTLRSRSATLRCRSATWSVSDDGAGVSA